MCPPNNLRKPPRADPNNNPKAADNKVDTIHDLSAQQDSANETITDNKQRGGAREMLLNMIQHISSNNDLSADERVELERLRRTVNSSSDQELEKTFPSWLLENTPPEEQAAALQELIQECAKSQLESRNRQDSEAGELNVFGFL